MIMLVKLIKRKRVRMGKDMFHATSFLCCIVSSYSAHLGCVINADYCLFNWNFCVVFSITPRYVQLELWIVILECQKSEKGDADIRSRYPFLLCVLL